MKRYAITQKVLNDIFETIENIGYLFYYDGSEITKEDVLQNFDLTVYECGAINIDHNSEDFRIEDLVLSNHYHEGDLIEII